MKTTEKITMFVILIAGLCLAGGLYYLFIHEGAPTDLDEPIGVLEEPEIEDTESVVVADIEGDYGVPIEEAVPAEEEADVGALTGLVLDPDRKPLHEADVILYRSKSPHAFQLGHSPDPLTRTKTEEDGTFLIKPLFPGDGYRLVVDHDLYMQEVLPHLSVKEEETTEVPPVQLQVGKTTYGKVRDQNSNPISGAVVSIYDPLKSSLYKDQFAPVRMVKTNEKGEYSIPFLENNNFIIEAAALGFESQTIRNEEIFTKKERYEFNFYLAKELTIKGQVVDVNMKPIAGAIVNSLPTRIENSGQKKGSQYRQNKFAETDEKGKFTLRGLSRGRYYLSATHPLYSSVPERNVEAGREDLFFVLERRSSISGKVVDTRGNPVRSYWINCTLKSTSTDAWASREIRKRYKDRNGRFMIDGVDPGKYELEVIASGYAPFRSDPVKVEREVPLTDLLITINKGGSVSGYVFTPDGKPLRRALVAMRRNNYVPNPVENMFGVVADSRMRSVRTDKEGFYKIEKILPGLYQLEFDHGKYPPHRINDVEVEIDKNREIETQYMKMGATLRGKVFNDANSPMVGAKVTLRKMDNSYITTTTSDMNGDYIVSDIPPGTYSVSPVPKIDMTQNPFNNLATAIRSVVRDVELKEGEIRDLTLIVNQ
jgi:protocatechuate 3,4-dioxygenase beta subunit